MHDAAYAKAADNVIACAFDLACGMLDESAGELGNQERLDG